MIRLFKRSAKLCVLIITTLHTASADATKWECGERSNLPVEGKNYCAGGDFRKSESESTKLLESLIREYQLTFDDVIALKNAQIAFETYRNNQCVAENKHVEHKPFHPMVIAQCRTRFTNLRIAELKRMHQVLLDRKSR